MENSPTPRNPFDINLRISGAAFTRDASSLAQAMAQYGLELYKLPVLS